MLPSFEHAQAEQQQQGPPELARNNLVQRRPMLHRAAEYNNHSSSNNNHLAATDLVRQWQRLVEPPTIAPCSVNTGREMSSDGLSIGHDFSRYRACGYFLPIALTGAGGVDIYWASCLLRDETPA